MNKLQLPTVTLFCADCINLDGAIAAIEKCKAVADFGDIRFMTSLETDYPHVTISPLKSLVHYSIWMIKECWKYVDTTHFLVCQHDGWIINPESWNSVWLNYDYVAPLFNQCNVMGSGGFSLRTKAAMKYISDRSPAWDGSQKDAEDRVQPLIGCYEDGHISGAMRDEMVHKGFKYAPIEESVLFAYGGNQDPAMFYPKPFGFHRDGMSKLGLL